MTRLGRIAVFCALLALLFAAQRPAQAAGGPSQPPDPILEQAIQDGCASQPATLRASVLVTIAETCVQLGQLEQAHRTLESAQQAALTPTGQAGDMPILVAKAWARLGFPTEALALAARLPVSGERLDVTIAAADAYAASGQAPKAAEAMLAALDTFTPAFDPVLATEALVAAAAHSEPTAARGLLARAAQAAATQPSHDRAAMLTSIARAYAHLGDDAEAKRLALSIEDPAARAGALLGTGQELAAKDEAAAVARVQEAADAGRKADPQSFCQALVIAAHEAYDAGRKALTAALLKSADQAASQAAGDTRQTLLRTVATLYGTLLNDWPTAMRIAGDSGDEWTLRTSRARAVIQLAAAGQKERATVLLTTAGGDKVGYIGQNLLQGLGDAYLQMQPGAGVDQVMRLQPEELRDQVLAAGARKALAAGDAAAGLDWAQHIAANNVREELLYQAALAVLDKADKADLPKAVEAARGVTSKLRSDDRRHGILFEIGRRYAALGDAAGVAQVLAEFKKGNPVQQEDVRALNDMAILQGAAGQAEAAQKGVDQALATVAGINCGSCREPALTDMLHDLLNAADTGLLVQAVRNKALLSLPSGLAIQVVDGLPALATDRKVLGLRVALQSAAAERMHGTAAETLCAVAVAWHKLGVAPSAQDLAVMPAPPQAVVEAEGPAPAAAPPSTAPATLAYFNSSTCALCREVHGMMDKLVAATPNVQIKQYELEKKDATLLNETFCTALNIPEQDRLVAPAIFSAKGALIGNEITKESLARLIQAARGQPSPEVAFPIRPDQAAAGIGSRYESLGLLVVIGAGLVDGINPCAFTVIIFFLSYLALLGRSKKEIVIAGSIFTAAVFLTYLAIGIILQGAFQFGQEHSNAFSRALYAATALVVFVAAILSVRDGVRCLQGRPEDMTLVLPDKLKSKIRLTIAKRARLGLTLGAMGMLGVVVALIQFPCTGQVYGPTIVFALKYLHHWGAFGWLVLYNLCSILPLVIVFIAVICGLTSERLATIFRRHVAATKFAMAGLFAILFGFLIYQLI